MFNKIIQLFCEHIYSLEIWQDYMSVGDKHHKIASAKIELTCHKCGKVITIYDKWFKCINWLRKEGESPCK